jgi:hypothetical protein
MNGAAAPVVILLTAAVGLGLYNGLLYLRCQRKPALIGVHLLLGIGGLEGILLISRGEAVAGGPLATAAVLVLGAAVVVGFTSPILGRRSRRAGETALMAHVTAGAAGFLLFLAWIAGQ